jgi:outer membrane protein assembly complex protein YaeT
VRTGIFPILILILISAPALAAENDLQRALPGAGLLLETVQDKARNKVEFTGQQSFTEAELRAPLAEEIRDVIEHGVTPARGDDLAFYVGSFYRKAGFSKAQVEYEIRGGKIVIKINEGPRSLLRKITFVGNTSIPDAELYDYMIGATPERLAREPAKFPYTSAEISAGADRVRGLYLSKGHLKVAVDASKLQLSADGKQADVTVSIVEGPRYSIGEVQFAGETLFPREELVAGLREPVTGPFAPGLADLMRRNLQSFYKARGYYNAEVAVEADPAQAVRGKVPMTFTVIPRGLFRFGSVSVRNESPRPRLRGDFLPKRFAHLRGEVYDPEKLDEAYREMLRTGLFENLRVSLKPAGDNELQLDLTATEAKAREIGFTIGAGSYEGVSLGIRLGDRNIFGSGRPLTFSADYSQRGLKGELLYVDPWLFDTRFALRARIYSESRDEEGYSKNALGARIDLSRKLLPHLELGVFVEGAQVEVTEGTIDPALLGPLDYQLAAAGLTQTTDFRNDPINPARGFVFTSSFELATIDGEPAFTRSILRFSYYLPLGKSMLALGARAGYIAPILDDLPIDVRFFNGGGTTVRSFAERELGPKDATGSPLGGDIYTVFNVEYTFPITGGLQGAAFVDAGNLINDDVSGSDEMRYAVGLGLRYKLPIGPLRLDYGVNPMPKADEDFGAFHFSFGFAF